MHPMPHAKDLYRAMWSNMNSNAPKNHLQKMKPQTSCQIGTIHMMFQRQGQQIGTNLSSAAVLSKAEWEKCEACGQFDKFFTKASTMCCLLGVFNHNFALTVGNRCFLYEKMTGITRAGHKNGSQIGAKSSSSLSSNRDSFRHYGIVAIYHARQNQSFIHPQPHRH